LFVNIWLSRLLANVHSARGEPASQQTMAGCVLWRRPDFHPHRCAAASSLDISRVARRIFKGRGAGRKGMGAAVEIYYFRKFPTPGRPATTTTSHALVRPVKIKRAGARGPAHDVVKRGGRGLQKNSGLPRQSGFTATCRCSIMGVCTSAAQSIHLRQQHRL
jgi:hypothetical protein